MKVSRRSFFSGSWLGNMLNSSKMDAQMQEQSADMTNYFSSVESCYAFLSEISLEDFRNEALKRGIPYEGISKFELAKKLFSAGYGEARKNDE